MNTATLSLLIMSMQQVMAAGQTGRRGSRVPSRAAAASAFGSGGATTLPPAPAEVNATATRWRSARATSTALVEVNY